MYPFDAFEREYYRHYRRQHILCETLTRAYHAFDARRLVQCYQTLDEDDVQRRAEKKFLKYFHFVAARVPAYKDFLKKRHIRPARIKTPQEYKKIPWVDKKNYLDAYPLSALCVDGRLEANQIISVSSGSTGKPHFWPRGILQELETTVSFETFFTSILGARSTKPTLLVQCFAMGMYIGGVFTINAVVRISVKGVPMILTTPGNQKEEIIRILIELAPEVDHIILTGYAPLMKDVVDLAISSGFSFQKHRVSFMFSGELISEAWRDMMAELTGAKNLYTFALNAYGTADAALLGHETPASIYFKRFFHANPEARRQFIEGDRDYSLLQYNPYNRLFENEKNELVFSAIAGTPLIRYNIHDTGGLVPYGAGVSFLKARGINAEKEITRLSGQKPWRLPMVYVFGRSDFTIVLHGANIYPENIKAGLESEELRPYASGKFVMEKQENKAMNPVFALYIELKPGVVPSSVLEKKFRAHLTDTLRRVNREYNVIYAYGDDVVGPRVALFPAGDERYFGRDIKQRWIKKPPRS